MSRLKYAALLGALKEIEKLLKAPEVPGNIDKANTLALSIATAVGPGQISDIAMRLISEANALGGNPSDRTRVNHALWHLRIALEEARRESGGSG